MDVFEARAVKMVLPAVLKKRHSLKDVNILPVIKRIRTGKPGSLKEFARVAKETKTETLSLDDLAEHVNNITGEELGELLLLAGRDNNVDEGRWALHCIILYSNEFGQPRGQDLSEETPAASASTSTSTVAPDVQPVTKNSGKRKMGLTRRQ